MLEKVTTPIYNFCHEIKVNVIHLLALLAEHLRGIASRVHQVAMRLFPFGNIANAATAGTSENLSGRATKISPDTETPPPVEPEKAPEPEPEQPDPVEPPKDEILPPVNDQTSPEPETAKPNLETAIVKYRPILKPINVNLPQSNLFVEIDQLFMHLHRPFVVNIPRIPFVLPEENRDRQMVVYVPPTAPLEQVAIVAVEATPVVESGFFGGAWKKVGNAAHRIFSAGQSAANTVVNTSKSVVAKTAAGVQGAAGVIIETSKKAAEMAGNGAKAVVDMGIEGAGAVLAGGRAVYRGKQELESGLDLYPYFITGAAAAVEAAQAGRVAYDDFMSQPTAPLDPVTANILHAFTDEIGKSLHNLLLNTLNLKGQVIAQKLAEKFNIVEIGGKKVAEGLLHLSNPLGWGMFISKMALTFTNLGIDLRGLTRGGAIAMVSDQLDSFFIETLLRNNRGSLTKEEILYYLKLEPVKVAKKNYDKLAKNPEAEELAQAAKQEWLQLEAEFNALGLSQPKELDRGNWLPTREEIVESKAAKCLPSAIIATILKNTLKKTIAHFLETMPATYRPVLKELIVGSPVTAAEQVMHQPLGLVGKVSQLAIAFYSNPINTCASQIPKPVKQVWNHTVAPANRLVGAVAADLLIGGYDESYINALGLKELDVVDKNQLTLNIMEKIGKSDVLSEDVMATVSELFGTSLDTRGQKLLQDAGRALARILVNGMAIQAAKMIGSGHTPEELISGKIAISSPRKAIRFAGTGFRLCIDHAIESAVYTTKEYGKTANWVMNQL